MTRTAFGGKVRGTLIQATATGVLLKLTTGEVREVHAMNLDPIKPRTVRHPGKRSKPDASKVKAVKVKAAKKSAEPVARVTVHAEQRDTRNDMQKYRHLFSPVTDRTQFADK